MSDAGNCLRKSKIRLLYLPPDAPSQPADCKLVKFYKKPVISYDNDYGKWVNGKWIHTYYDFICPVISTRGVGSIIAIVQIGIYIEFYVTFYDKNNIVIRETHRIFVEIPIMIKLPFTEIFLSRLMPLKMRISHYILKAMAALGDISEIEDIIAKLDLLKDGMCEDTMTKFKASLENFQILMQEMLDRAASHVDGGIGDVAMMLPSAIPLKPNSIGSLRDGATRIS
jgi:hypothetical protein